MSAWDRDGRVQQFVGVFQPGEFPSMRRPYPTKYRKRMSPVRNVQGKQTMAANGSATPQNASIAMVRITVVSLPPVWSSPFSHAARRACCSGVILSRLISSKSSSCLLAIFHRNSRSPPELRTRNRMVSPGRTSAEWRRNAVRILAIDFQNRVSHRQSGQVGPTSGRD